MCMQIKYLEAFLRPWKLKVPVGDLYPKQRAYKEYTEPPLPSACILNMPFFFQVPSCLLVDSTVNYS